MGKNNSNNSNNKGNNKSNNKVNNKSNNKVNNKSDNKGESNILLYIIITVILLFLYSNYVMNPEVIVEEEESLDNNKEDFISVDDHQEKVLYLMNRRKCFVNKYKKNMEEQNVRLDELTPKIRKLKQNLILLN